jgi:hypothetical protein
MNEAQGRLTHARQKFSGINTGLRGVLGIPYICNGYLKDTVHMVIRVGKRTHGLE